MPGWSTLTVRPLVLGPDSVPVIADEKEVARDVPLAVFSAITHGKGPDTAAILVALAAGLKTIDPDSAAVFAQLTESGLVDPQAQKIWRDLMTTTNYFFRHEVAEKVREEGRDEARAEERGQAILRTLDWRGVELSEADRERVRSCGDLDRLAVWLDRSYEVTDAAGLFDGDEV
ncbi:hypothetical protein ACH4D5_14475 [Streptomyces sp. NPDC018029]|uniref:hypothetical protein n=1 Tax=Streptomyces sp. NPDC018029 TaxID=3365032 RepID=UPI00378DF048